MTSITPPVADFTAASVFSPVGYNQTKIDDTHYQVQASGTEATPKDRVEKIARARAAQIGVDEKLKFFKVTSVQHSITCNRRQEGYKTTSTPASARPSVVLDVVYAKDTTDPSFQSSRGNAQHPEDRPRRGVRRARGARGGHPGDARELQELAPSDYRGAHNPLLS